MTKFWSVLLALLVSLPLHASTAHSTKLRYKQEAPPPPPLKPDHVGKWQPLRITSKAIGAKNSAQTPVSFTIGKLIWRGGISLSASNKNFGGFSGLRLSENGQSLLAVSDRAHWLKARPVYADNGAIVALEQAQIASIMRYNGSALRDGAGDAEGLELLADGTAIVSFERYHRLDLYPLDKTNRYVFGRRVMHNRLLQNLASNGALEAVLHLADGRLLTLAERVPDTPITTNPHSKARPGWVSLPDNWQEGGDEWQTLAYLPASGFSVTDLAQDPQTEDIYVLERWFSRLKGIRARLARLPVSAVQPGALMQGEEIAQLSLLQGIDNMEGLALRRLADGRLMAYMISDDNFNIVQRTVLMSWEIVP